MKTILTYAAILVWGIACGIFLMADKQENEGLRSRHRITPRLELVIDSGRVDTVFVYRVQP